MEHYTPFGFYREFLDKDIYRELDKYYFYSDPIDLITLSTDIRGNSVLLGEITRIDKEKHIIEYTDSGENKTYSLENNIKNKLSSEIEKTIQYIEIGIENRLTTPKEIEVFTHFLNKGLSAIKNTKAYNDFDFLKNYFKKIEDIIATYSAFNITENSTTITNNIYSYTLISENPIETIKKLYFELTNQKPNPLISCSEQDFINAFTGKEVKEGICWLIVGKNKHTSKPSLFYFIDNLRKLGFISNNILNDYNKYIKYIFRDSNGNELKNIKQSRASFSNIPQDSTLINNILSIL